MNAEQKLLAMAWKKGLRDGEVRFPQVRKQDAARLRMMLYTIAQGAKKAPHLDFELADAVSECFVTLEDEEKTVVIKLKSSTNVMNTLKGVLGLTDEALQKEVSAGPTLSSEEAEIMGRLQSSALAGLITKG